MNWLIKNFLRGLVIVVPIALTAYLAYQAFVRLDQLLKVDTPGLGLAILVVAIIGIGVLAGNFVGRRFFSLTETLFTKAPIVRIVYAAIKDLLEAFVGNKRRFDRPVTISVSRGCEDARLHHARRPRPGWACRATSPSTSPFRTRGTAVC